MSAPGQAAFEAYERSASGDPGYKPYPWPEVDRRGRKNWDAAAQAAIEASPELRGHTAEIERLRGLLDEAAAAEQQLARIRELLTDFDWEHDDRQYALEHIDDIVNGRTR